MTAPSEWWQYIESHAPALNPADLARLTGLHISNISRWRSGDAEPSAHAVVTVARALGRPPVEALAAAAIIDWSEVTTEVVERPITLDNYPIDELFQALATRLRALEAAHRPLAEYSFSDIVTELSTREIK